MFYRNQNVFRQDVHRQGNFSGKIPGFINMYLYKSNFSIAWLNETMFIIKYWNFDEIFTNLLPNFYFNCFLIATSTKESVF